MQLVTSVEGLVSEKEALAARDKALVDALNVALGEMSYHVVPVGGETPGRKPRGRPPGSGNGRRKRAKRGPGRTPKNGRRKRRTRYPKAEQG